MMDEKIKKIAKLWKRGIYTTMEAWQAIVDVYLMSGFTCTLGTAEYILEYFVTLV